MSTEKDSYRGRHARVVLRLLDADVTVSNLQRQLEDKDSDIGFLECRVSDLELELQTREQEITGLEAELRAAQGDQGGGVSGRRSLQQAGQPDVCTVCHQGRSPRSPCRSHEEA